MPENINKISFLKHSDIDIEKWDNCIKNSPNGNLYANSWYLDLACPGWSAIATGDYSSVMPLPVRKKLSLSYIYQPFFVQQLGVFSLNTVSEELLINFLKAIPKHIKYVDYNLNFRNNELPDCYTFVKNTTYHLPLDSNYKELLNNYAENTRRNLRKAEKANLTIQKDLKPAEIVEFKRQTAKADLDKDGYKRLQKIISWAVKNNTGKIYGATDSSGNLCAVVFFAFSKNYAYMLVSASDNKGKDNSAMFLLIDNFIRENSGKKIILDFEGSNIPGIARFFAGFGAKPVYYHKFKMNRLPKILKSIKK